MKMLKKIMYYVVCGRHLEFLLKNMLKGKINVRNEIPMAELVKIDLLFVKIAPQMKKFCSARTDGRQFGKRCFFGTFPPKIERGIEAHF